MLTRGKELKQHCSQYESQLNLLTEPFFRASQQLRNKYDKLTFIEFLSDSNLILMNCVTL